MTDNNKLLASLTGYTPGPWVWGEYNNGLNGNGDVVLTYDDYDGMSCGDDANAALIAAAPDLHRIATEQAAENKRLRDAVAPIAAFAALVCASNAVDDFVLTMGSRLAATQLTVGHMRMLHAALAAKP
jgi:hypothetical protein